MGLCSFCGSNCADAHNGYHITGLASLCQHVNWFQVDRQAFCTVSLYMYIMRNEALGLSPSRELLYFCCWRNCFLFEG